MESNDIPHQQRLGMARGYQDYQAAALFFKLQVLPGVALSIGHALDLRQARGFDDLEAHLAERTC